MKTIIGALESVEAAIRRNPEAHPYQDHVLTEIEAIEGIASAVGDSAQARVTSLSECIILSGTIFEVVGIPIYLKDFSDYPEYGLTEEGWYVFVQIFAPNGVRVTDETTVDGAAGAVIEEGTDYVDVAVRFNVTAESQKVTVAWGGRSDTFIFKADDLAIRNLDYRTTFYVYDSSPYVRWEYALASGTAIVADKAYFVKNGDEYTEVEVTVGDPIPTVYYDHAYELTADETFVSGKTYYTRDGDVYTAAEVTAGEAVALDTYYVDVYSITKDATFAEGKTYYTLASGVYTAAEVTTGAEIAAPYYNHSKVILSGLARNITYRLSTVVDCPMEFILPTVEDKTHGCWYEIRCVHSGEYSMALTPPSADVKVGTEHTQKETKGLNSIVLHYNYVTDKKVWRFLNTHTTIPD